VRLGTALTGGAAALVGAGAAAGLWGTVIERNWFAVREATLRILPEGADDLRVLHLSDLHMAPWQRNKQRFVRRLAEFEPDLVIDTGDNLGHEIGLLGIRAALEPFRGVPGLFVWGSNDYWGPTLKNPFAYFEGPSGNPPMPHRLDLEALGSYLGDLGWTDLNNAATRITIGALAIDAFGVDDPHREYDRPDALPAAIAAARAGASAAPLVLGVAHAPYQRTLDALVDLGADLLFAGHTHGGQVCVPGYGALVTNCDIPRQQVKGVSGWSRGDRTAMLNVSGGIGTSIFAPVRFANRPEASLLTLTAA
jgi:uncharacterized protein